MLIIVLTVANNVIIGAILPNIHAVFLVTKSFERRYEPRRNGVLHCRDRRPRRSVSRAFYPQHNVDMIGHNHVTLNRQVIVKVVQLTDVFISDLSVFCQFDLRTVGDAGPYNTRKNTVKSFSTLSPISPLYYKGIGQSPYPYSSAYNSS